MQHLTTNSLLQGGKYKIEKVLGQGGFGITYLATQELLDRKVCVKEFFFKEFCKRINCEVVIASNTGVVERFRNKFIKEAQMIAQMDNAHIIPIYDVFEENGTAYYVMKYFEGGTLDELIQQGPLSIDKALHYIRQIADALQYCHARSVLHLDVKPSNILIQDDVAILIDFGISKRYDNIGCQTSTTPVGISHGYAPLEQYNFGGVSNFSPATDVYSLGATLYKLLIGVTPPDANEINENGLSPLPLHIPFFIQNTIRQAMLPRRKSRLQSVDEFLCLLDGDGFDLQRIDEYYRLAEGGDITAQIHVGNYCIHQNDGEQALLWFEKAAEQNSPKAQFNIAFCYEAGAGGVEKNYKKAAMWYYKAAEQGGFISQFRLGRLYFLGWGVQTDYTKAVNWFRRSAEQGYDEAQYFLGVCYRLGCGIEQDLEQAEEWNQKAAEQGHEEAIKKAKEQKQSDFEPSYSQAVKLYNEAEELFVQDNKDAYSLYNRAFRLFIPIALQGNREAQFYLAYCYSNGLGVDEDKIQAVEWYRRSAEQGDATSQNNLGVCYDLGQGVCQDKKMAAEWFRKSAEQGDDCAQCNLADYYKDGIGLEKNLALAAKWYKKSAEQGNERAVLNLADCYYYGNGLDVDKEKAIELYNALVDKGNEMAVKAIQRIEEEKTYVVWENSRKGQVYNLLGKILSWFPTLKYLFMLFLVWLVFFIAIEVGLIKNFINLSSKTGIAIMIGILIVMQCYNYFNTLRECFEYKNRNRTGSICLSLFYLISIILSLLFMIIN